jgi:AraC-like DNA-binding protein
MPSHQTTLVRLPRFVLRQAELAGLDRAPALAAAGLTEEQLADPDARIQPRKDRALWPHVFENIPDIDLGIRWAAALSLQDAGLVGYAMLHSATLGDALERLIQFSRILSDTNPPRLKLSDGTVEYSYDVDPVETSTLSRLVEFELAAVVGTARQLTGVDLAPLLVGLPHKRPSGDLTAHRNHFRCELVFESPRARLVLRRRHLELPVMSADEQLGQYLERHAQSVLAKLAPAGSIVDRVERAIWGEMKDGELTVLSVARSLGFSTRSLQRQLAAAGTTFSALLDTTRQAMAAELLVHRSLAIYEVALLLGYSEPSTFYRAFRRWTGISPREFRDAALA